MVNGEYEVIVHEQVGNIAEIKYFKKYEHFKDWSNKDQQTDSNTRSSDDSKERQLTPEDFGVYPKLVKLWGHGRTGEELRKLIEHYPDKNELSEGTGGDCLDDAFTWSATPQGWKFWYGVNEQLQNL